MKIALHGATGRMGLAITRLAQAAGDVQVVGAVSHPEDPHVGKDLGDLAGVGSLGVTIGHDVPAALLGADVVIDFSLPPAVPALLHAAQKARVPVVMGTTGLSDEQQQLIDRTAENVGVLWARNMSLGIHVLSDLVSRAVAMLGDDFDVEIVDVHHRRKIDAPSGTALRLMDAVKQARSAVRPVCGREGQVGARTDEEVAVIGLRGGDVIGDHTVHLMGPGERLELTHRATSRDVFAHGALRAARWMVGKPAGRYSLDDVLA